MRFVSVLFVVMAAAALVAGCDTLSGLTSGDCTTILIPALSVRAVDSLNGTSVIGGATVRATDGTFVDSAVVPMDRPDLDQGVPLAYERAGTYQVSVLRSGYRTWTQSDVRVRKTTCHVETAKLVARLVRAP